MTEPQIQIPNLIPVFPLPKTILFPNTELPLYIFEPRYRQMLEDCRTSHKIMAVSMLRKGWENSKEPASAHDVVGVGYVRAVFDHPDGTSHIVLKGITKAKIIRYEKMEPYRVARIRVLSDKSSDTSEMIKLASKLRRLVEMKLKMCSESPYETVELSKELENPVALSHFACHVLDTNMNLKQDLLESTNPNFRMRHLIDLFKEDLLPPGSEN